MIYDFPSSDVHVLVSEEKVSPNVICFYEVTCKNLVFCLYLNALRPPTLSVLFEL